MKSLGRYHQQGVNSRRRRGKQVINEENEEYRGMTEPWGTPALIESRLERKPFNLTASDLSERKLPIHLMRM